MNDSSWVYFVILSAKIFLGLEHSQLDAPTDAMIRLW